MGSSSLQAAIFTNEARAETLTNEITDNSMDLRLHQKRSSKEISDIHAQYAPEKERIQNEIEGLDKIEQQDEYQDLMTELKDLREEEEAAVKQVEDETNDYETNVQTENEMLEVQLEEVNTTTESFKEMLKQNIENEFGYFQ
ncbi:MAG: hypothetical protein E7Z88_07795 [Cyanobacteria bacterium SIG27]|nr:hypothetical protein [Cyanobacteria bacterium SIG27]